MDSSSVYVKWTRTSQNIYQMSIEDLRHVWVNLSFSSGSLAPSIVFISLDGHTDSHTHFTGKETEAQIFSRLFHIAKF